jgi:hypothetical protein
VNRSNRRVAAAWAAIAVLALAASACTAGGPTAHPTVIYKFITPSPGEDTPTPFPTASTTDTPVATDTSVATATASVSVSPTAKPTPGPTSPAAACAGSASSQAWFAAESKKLSHFDVYCGAHLPSGWHFTIASDDLNQKWLTATYSGKSGAKIVLKEGAFCLTSSVACSPHNSYLGSANFGDKSGGIYSLTSGGYAIYVAPGTSAGYTATGTSVTETAFIQIVAAVRVVPKA